MPIPTEMTVIMVFTIMVQASFLPLQANQFPETESTVVDQEEGLGWVLWKGIGKAPF